MWRSLRDDGGTSADPLDHVAVEGIRRGVEDVVLLLTLASAISFLCRARPSCELGLALNAGSPSPCAAIEIFPFGARPSKMVANSRLP